MTLIDTKHEIITRITFGAFALSLFTLGCDPGEPVSDEELLAAEEDEELDDLAAEPGDEEPEELPVLEARSLEFGLTAALDPQSWNWTGVWFSEETPPSTCPAGNLVTGVACSGDSCDNMQLECHGTYALGATSWTTWFSEEGTNYRICSGSAYVSGMACQGGWCDNLSLQCANTNTTPAVHTCQWSGFFSNEDPAFYAPVGTAIKGAQCNGGHCDQLRYYYCPIN